MSKATALQLAYGFTEFRAEMEIVQRSILRASGRIDDVITAMTTAGCSPDTVTALRKLQQALEVSGASIRRAIQAAEGDADES